MKALSLLVAAALLAPAAAFADDPHETIPAAEAAATGDSIYLLGGTFTNQDGKRVSLEELRGKPVLISMFYATCPHACPMLISDIKRVEAAVPPEVREKLQVVLVTFDPERDTPEKMKALRDAHQVDGARWSMLTTQPSKVQELAAVLGIKYRFAKGGAINHSTVITLLDENGVIVERLDGLRQPEAPIVQKLVSRK